MLRRVRLEEVTQVDIERWRELARTACEPNPYLEPDYLLPFARAAGSLDSVLHFLEIDGSLVLCALITPERRPLGPLTFGALSTSSNFGEIEMARRHPLVASVNPAGVLSAWLSAIGSLEGPSVLWWQDLFADGPLAEALRTATHRAGLPTLVHGHGYVPYIRAGEWRPPIIVGPEAQFGGAHMSTKALKRMRLYARKIHARFGEEVTWSDRAADPMAIEDFITLQAAGWKGSVQAGGTAFSHSLARSDALREFTATYRASGRLAVGSLAAAGTVLHLSIAAQSLSGMWTTLFDAFDERFAEYGAGHLGRLALFQHLASTSPGSDIDPVMRTTDHVLLGLFPSERPVMGALIGAGDARARALVRIVQMRERIAERNSPTGVVA